MENTYSLSDIAAASKNNDYDGFGGGAWWIIILFLFMFGMGGWNNRNANSNGDPVTEAGLCNAMNFNDLQNQVGRLSDQNQQQTQILGNGICNLGYEMQRNVGQLGKVVALSQANLAQQVSSAQSDLSSQLAQCCCTTQRAIDGVNYNQAINTASINANIDAKFAAMEKNQLEQTIAAQQAQISQLQLAQQMNNVVRYPNGFTYNAGMSPFCGGCCSGC